MFCDKQNNQTDIINGLQIDEPNIFIPWDINENGFVDIFENHNVVRNIEKYCGIKSVTVFGEINCNIIVKFGKTIREFGISRDYHEGYIFEDDFLNKSFKNFQTALEKTFGKPTKARKGTDGFVNYVWEIDKTVEIQHYVMDRFGLAEYLYITHI